MSIRDDFDENKKSKVRELAVEKYLQKQIKNKGGKCLKFVSPGYDGVPDRLVIYQGVVVFVECKRPGEKPRKLQSVRMKELWSLGCHVFCVSCDEDVDMMINQVDKYVKHIAALELVTGHTLKALKSKEVIASD